MRCKHPFKKSISSTCWRCEALRLPMDPAIILAFTGVILAIVASDNVAIFVLGWLLLPATDSHRCTQILTKSLIGVDLSSSVA
jgi:hypothetical protein